MKKEVEGVFRLLHPKIQKLLVEKGFLKPTEPQEKAIPLILEGRNVLLIAPTGTGKTEAAILPILSNFLRLIENGEIKEEGIYILYITPLRALNRDLLDRLTWWCNKLEISVAVRHGDTEQSERSRQAKHPPQMLITTPETLQAILSGRRMREHLKKVRWVIIDEIHELAEDKRGSQLCLALERLYYIKGNEEFQRVGLSATIGSPDKVAKFLVGERREVSIIRVPVARLMKLKVVYPEIKPEDYVLASKLYTHPEVAARLRVIKEIIEKHKTTLVFVNTRAIAEVLASRFQVWNLDFPIGVHHGSLAKPSRIAAEKGLKKGKLKALVATSSLELGIDIGHIEVVVQYMSPRQVTRLVQRVGRSGHRVGGLAKGVIITLDPKDTLEAMVIARKALKEELEPVKIPEKPLDVLTHQIVALFQIRRRWKFDEILNLYRRAYPYRNLTKDDLVFVLRYMHNRYPRLAWISEEDEVVLKPRNSRSMFEYFFEELSMIPDEKHYLVIDETNNTPVGLLDEAFVAEYGEPGTKFVFRGNIWVISEIRGDRIYVRQVSDPTGAIPSWVGEEIPVPYEVSQEVGEIHGRVEEMLKEGLTIDEIASKLSREYPIDRKSLIRALQVLEDHYKAGYPMPTNKRLLIETWNNVAVIHVFLGLLGNRALGYMIAEILALAYGHTLGVQQDAYHIIIQFPERIKAEKVYRALLKIGTYKPELLVERIARRSGLFKRRMIHVARRFGALSKKVSFYDISLRRLVDMFEGTPIFEEAFKEFITKDIDINVVKKFIEMLEDGEIEVKLVDSETPSPLTRLALERIARKTELIPPERMRKIIIEAAKARLLNEARVFICLECWNWVSTMRIKDVKELKCPLCNGTTIGMLNVDEEKARKLASYKGKVRKREYRNLLEQARETARLLKKYGKLALIALASKGLKIKEVEEILVHHKEFNDEFIEAIVEAERKALRRRFI